MVERVDAAIGKLPKPPPSFAVLLKDGSAGWQHRGDYAIWSGVRTRGAPSFVLQELTPKGIVALPAAGDRLILHRIAAGTSYHVHGLHGGWIVDDADAVWLETRGPEATYSTLMVGGTVGKPARGRCHFVCPACATPFGEASADIPAGGYSSFIAFANERVQAFNSSPNQRTCPRCAAVHPEIGAES